MVFTSLNFLIFFPCVIFIYYLLPKRIRWLFLLITSLFFYVNINPIYALLLVSISCVTYFSGKYIEKLQSDKAKEKLLTVSLILILLPLFFFKYYNFVNEGIFSLLENFNLKLDLPRIDLMLPVGISFYTFMAISYIVDVYNEEIKAEKNIGLIILFLSFFPLVLSGPIERASSMLPQFKDKLEFDYKKATNGLKLMLWGYFMKLVVADRVSKYITPIFNEIDTHSGSTLLLSTLLYPIQLYADLGGYSLIAIGSANVMGINVRPNFNRPFFATTISGLWRRWHMSLINWILDYVYTPLSFSLRKYKIWGIVIAVTLTFLISGLWHGAALTFILWAAYQFIFVGIEVLTKKKKDAFEQKFNLTKKKWYLFFSIILTYLIFSFSFITGGNRFSAQEGVIIFKKIISNLNSTLYFNIADLTYVILGAFLLLISEFRDEFFPNKFKVFENKNIIVRWFGYFSIIILILLIGVFDGGNFIYFKF